MTKNLDVEGITNVLGGLHLLAKLLDNLKEGVELDESELGIIGGIVEGCANTLEGYVPVHVAELNLQAVRKAG